MSFPRYAKYKASGVEWLGEVPEHWTVKPLKYIASFASGGTPSKENTDYWDGGVPWASAKDLKVDVLHDTEDHLSDQAISAGAATLEAADSVLVLVRGMMLARAFPVVLTGQPMAINQDLKALRGLGGTQGRFLAWLLRGSERESLSRIDEAGHGTKALRMEAWTSMFLPVPPVDEQSRVAEILDEETSKIDALVAEQERLIALLKEKRQAVVSHSVTKGLDPNASMKDSGVEWLGDVPAHWTVEKFSRQIAIAEGQVDPREEPFASMLLIAPNHIESGTGRLINLETASEQGADSGKYQFDSGAVIYSKIRPHLAKATIAPNGGLCSADMYPLSSRGGFDHRYLLLVLLTPGFTACATLESDRVAMPKINREKLNELRLPLPPTAEQAEIVEHVARQTTAIDAMHESAEQAIALLQERRSALISAAVTGKIDVRGLTAEAEAA